MPAAIEEISTITAKGQTTVPKAVRQALGVDYGGRIAFRVSGKGVTVVRADDDEDPAISEFLSFIGADIRAHPERVKGLSPETVARIGALVEGMSGDTDEAIDGDVAL